MAADKRAEPLEVKNVGLRGVVVADSTISKVDGERGTLIYRGYDIAPLAREGSYEEVVYLLLRNKLPSAAKLDLFKDDLAAARTLPAALVDMLGSLPRGMLPMDVLQAAVPVLGACDPELEMSAREECCRQAQRLTTRLPLVLSAWERLRNGRDVIDSDPTLGHAANFLYTMFGERPDAETEKTMDAVLVLHADHGFNASTFTARQIASTRAHIYAAVSGALGSLSGELHGGANERVYRMLQEIGSVGRVREYVLERLDRKERIMGLGHAVYKVTDPRARILGPMAEKLAESAGRSEIYAVAEEVRRVAGEEFMKRKGREIYPNVDFFSAIVNAMIGIPVDCFTPVFALGRIAGWSAHYLEERFGGTHAKPALYRPKAEYVGRYCGLEACEWSPLDRR